MTNQPTPSQDRASERADELTAAAQAAGTETAHRAAYRAHRRAAAATRDDDRTGFTPEENKARGARIRHHLDAADRHTRSAR